MPEPVLPFHMTASVIPFDRLPAGFAESIDNPPADPVHPRPAATVVLLRDGDDGPEVLLLRRVRSSGFVPGAYVFPGGRVDADDSSAALLARWHGPDPATVAERMGLDADASPPAMAYVLASLREAFEETGLLLARDADGVSVASAANDEAMAAAQGRLLTDDDLFAPVLEQLDATLRGDAVAYIAHWITPVVEPRRYDTRFFAAAVEGDSEVAINPAEMTDAVWLTPERALERHREGTLPMVFPTVHTIEGLAGFESAAAIIAEYRRREVPPILPRLVRTELGVGLEID